ncbi:HDOD domain-containing protein [Rhodoferax sp. U11-2br]|uniref:HDOD domain-containing protein n=1 Tax=Rhodoferax sp. U11-2br TaxID=2838878 RepID=UPI001BE651DA|nr:HDOD domain-containing protein [Rhodoferax sp. U11-2br]MBT3068931.1 HDOD domain-containing protein [Rhodoferax sp. U11-2br]
MEPTALLSSRFVMPSRPRAVALLLVELARPEPDLRRIDQLVSSDPALAMRLLQAANANYFGLTGQIHGVSEALAVLRLGQVQAMVASAAAVPGYPNSPSFDITQFWAYSLDCAKVARSLAGLLRLNQQAAFTCGLIHAVGELAMRSGMSQVVALDARSRPLGLKRSRVERRVFGFCYTEVSAWLARQWHLPTLIHDALLFAHAPFDHEPHEPMAGVVHLAIWRARARQVRLSENAMTVSFPSLVAEVMGLDIDLVLQQDPIDWSLQEPGRPLI